MDSLKWECVDRVLCTYRCGEFTAQRTWMDTVALWSGKTRIGAYGTLDEALEAIRALKG